MRRMLVGLAAVLVAVSSVSVLSVTAQAQQPAQEKLIEAKIKSVDPSGKTVTLTDGTVLMIPDTVQISRAELKPGATVKASYEEKGGQKIVTSLEVRAQ